VATNRTRDSLASSNDTKPIHTHNLVPTPQPMTATLIFRRQLVRHKPDLLTASSTADKLPLEKFHRLLDLAFWGGKHQKISILSQIACNPFGVILLDIYLFIYFIFFTFCTGYHSTRLFLTLRACGAPITRPGGRATLSCSSRPTITDRKTKINLMIATLKQLLEVICKSISCLSFSNFIFFECVAIIKSVLI
jgi:hypothetical protein